MSLKDKYSKNKKAEHPVAEEAAASMILNSSTQDKKNAKKIGKKATFVLDEDLHIELKTAAAKIKCNMADLVEQGIRQVLNDLKESKKI